MSFEDSYIARLCMSSERTLAVTEPERPANELALDSQPCEERSSYAVGEMAEWFKAHAWKACVANHYRGFESLSLRHVYQ